MPVAEKHAIDQALKHGPKDVPVASDHRSSVKQGNLWSPELASGQAAHASTWRRAFGLYGEWGALVSEG
eukprot:9129139-Pyramimonas_sp.AAC.1